MQLPWHNKPNDYVTPENFQISKPYTPWVRIKLALCIILVYPFMLVFYLIFKPLWGAFILAGQAGSTLAFYLFKKKPHTWDPAYNWQWVRCWLSQEAARLPHINTPFRKMLYRLSGLHVGKGGFIGYGGILEDLYPQNVVIEDFAEVSFGVTLVGHGPRRNHSDPKSKMIIIRHHAYVGARSVLVPGVEIGHHAMVGAGSVVTKSVPAGAVVAGCPARILYYKSGFEPKEDTEQK